MMIVMHFTLFDAFVCTNMLEQRNHALILVFLLADEKK